MALGLKQMMEAANAVVPKITPSEARQMIGLPRKVAAAAAA